MRAWPTALFLAAVSAVLAAAAEAPVRYDLLAACDLALAASPLAQRAAALRDAEAAGVAAARGPLRPEAGVAAEAGRHHAEIAGLAPRPVDDWFNASSVGVYLSQALFDAAGVAAVRSAEARLDAGEAAREAVEQAVRMETGLAYVDLLGARAADRVAASRHGLLERVAAQARAAREAGTGDAIAALEAEAALDAAASARASAGHAVRVARARLAQLTGVPPGDPVGAGEAPPAGPDPAALDVWVARALEGHPALRQARARVEAARWAWHAARRREWPGVSVAARYIDEDGALLPSMEREQAGVAISLRVPLLSGGALDAEARRAAALRAAEEAALRAGEDRVRLEVEQAFLAVADSVGQFRAAEQARRSAALSLEAVRRGHEIGSRSLTELVRAVDADTRAASERDAAVHGHLRARLRLDAAAGALDREAVRRLNARLSREPVAGGGPEGGDHGAGP